MLIEIINTVKKDLLTVTRMSILDKVFTDLRTLDYATLTTEERRIITKVETLIVLSDDILDSVIKELDNL